jgi:hypothetical protein
MVKISMPNDRNYEIGGHTDEMEIYNLNKRVQEIKEMAMLPVDTAARNQKIEIEKSISEDPYAEHLYTEREFEHLIYLELRSVNSLLRALVDLARANQITRLEPLIERETKQYTDVVCTCPKRPSVESGELISCEQNDAHSNFVKAVSELIESGGDPFTERILRPIAEGRPLFSSDGNKETPPENKGVEYLVNPPPFSSFLKIDPEVDKLLNEKANEIKRGRPKKYPKGLPGITGVPGTNGLDYEKTE